MLELVEVGDDRLPGEVVSIREESSTVQVYEYTGGLRPGTAVVGHGRPLSVALGPGLLGGVFDGILRPARRSRRAARRRRRLGTRWRRALARSSRAPQSASSVGPAALLGRSIQETPGDRAPAARAARRGRPARAGCCGAG